ncbi:MAG: ClbS/DfsB family four-helix bundle protein [Chloroflexota bacterium]|nr:ClbS/DfsB family four-helix bundle protein [Chloroflexota bacterium]
MTETGTKARVLEAIDAERAAWHALVVEVGEDRMEEPGPMGAWSFKDLAAHLTGWRQRSLDQIEAAQRGETDAPPPWPAALSTDDEINAWIHRREHDRPLAAVLADADATFARLRASVDALSEAELNDAGRFAWMEGHSLGPAILSGDFFGHLHEEHEPDVRAWLDRRSAAGGTR